MRCRTKRVYRVLRKCEICKLAAKEELKWFTTMLERNTRSYYASNMKGKVTTFEEATDMLTEVFTSDELKSCTTLLFK